MAEVGAIVKTSEHNRHAVYVYDFDPATDEVIVVKKDAARVWVEGDGGERYLREHQPRWNGHHCRLQSQIRKPGA